MSATEDDRPAAASNDPRIPLYRVVDATELVHLQMNGTYGSNPSRSGKYFALTLAGARAFAAALVNSGSTVTQTTLPQSVLKQGWRLIDPGPYGAGASVYFSETQLTTVYSAMTLPVIVNGVGSQP